jgi:hypothetical protein
MMSAKNGPIRTVDGRIAAGNPGRPKGTVLTKTKEIREFARHVLLGDNPEIYGENVRRRILAGDAPHMETFFAQHLWGKPTENINLNLTEQHLLAVRLLSDLELTAFLRALEHQQPEQALRLLPGGKDA